MIFGSDNWGPAHPAVLDALAAANAGRAEAYGADALTARATALVREVFEAPEAEVLFLASGTAANALALAALVRPWQAILSSDLAHVLLDETGAAEFYSAGAKLIPVASRDAKISPEALRDAIAHAGRVHSTPPAALSLTQATERGTLYTPAEIAELSGIARGAGLAVHVDGARIANAIAALGVAPADLTWRAGVDALSLGGTKGGCLAAEAVVVFDPAKADGLRERRARSGHLLSKSRFLAAQYLAWLGDGLWLDLAARANAAARRLADGLAAAGIEVVHPPEIDMVWAILPEETDRRLAAAGARYHAMDDMAAGPLVRLVCDWSTTEAEVDAFLDAVRGA